MHAQWTNQHPYQIVCLHLVGFVIEYFFVVTSIPFLPSLVIKFTSPLPATSTAAFSVDSLGGAPARQNHSSHSRPPNPTGFHCDDDAGALLRPNRWIGISCRVELFKTAERRLAPLENPGAGRRAPYLHSVGHFYRPVNARFRISNLRRGLMAHLWPTLEFESRWWRTG